MYQLSMRPLSIGTPQVLFDLSRLIRNRRTAFGTGVDRIDLAIASDLLRRFGPHCHFVYAGIHGVCLLPQPLGAGIVRDLESLWNTGGERRPVELQDAFEKWWKFPRPQIFNRIVRPQKKIVTPDTTYVVASHSGVGKVQGGMRSLDPGGEMRRLLYIHDLIPLEFPEYQRPETAAQFFAYINELVQAPFAIVSNSFDTESRFKALAEKHGWPLTGAQVIVPTLDFRLVEARPPQARVAAFLEDDRPYFVVLGTIEPRKNHLLLLNIWRNLGRTAHAPRLCIIGRRGWENENIVDMLDRCVQLHNLVFEFADLGDHEVQTLLQGAQALLFPSFTEGLGIPILEAAALGTDCVVSDIPAFREIAPAGTAFLDPLDGPGWLKEVSARASAPLNGKARGKA